MNLIFQDAQVLLDEVVVGHYHDQVVNVQDRLGHVRERNGERIALSEVFTSPRQSNENNIDFNNFNDWDFVLRSYNSWILCMAASSRMPRSSHSTDCHYISISN